jgi:flagellar motility protein MotE (MotC chaperone)
MSGHGEPRNGSVRLGALAARLRGRPSPFLATAASALALALVHLADLAGRLAHHPGFRAAPLEIGSAPPNDDAERAAGLFAALLPVPAVEPAAGPPSSPLSSSAPESGTGPKAVSAKPSPPSPSDPLADVAAELERRAAELDRREQELVLREAAAAAIEARLAEQLDRLQALKQELERTAARIQEKDEAELAQLVKTYEAMKAKAAAQVFDQLALDVLLPIVRRMRDAKLAAVLAAMDPVKAKQLTAALAQTTPLPRLP